ncbi:MAG: hypothetical protein JNM72_18795 [Deltaproteobacteria bacterium]|nr:hypothetical protein [Deltaproteobacteria bacterium]
MPAPAPEAPPTAPPAPRPAAPGDGPLHPLILGAAALMALNDQLLKGWGPGWLTGKLSDLAGLAFAPALLVALLELALCRFGLRVGDRRLLLLSIMATGGFFSAIQLHAGAASVWTWGLGAAQWPLRALLALVSGGPSPALRPVVHTADPSDLLTLPALALPLALGWARSRPVLKVGTAPHDPQVEGVQSGAGGP